MHSFYICLLKYYDVIVINKETSFILIRKIEGNEFLSFKIFFSFKKRIYLILMHIFRVRSFGRKRSMRKEKNMLTK